MSLLSASGGAGAPAEQRGGGGGGGGGVGKTSLALASVNFANGVIGAGIVGLPAAIRQAGLPLGVLMCVGVACVSQYTIRLLAQVGTAQGTASYVELAQRAFGPTGFYVTSAFQAAFTIGVMITYLVIFKDTMPGVLAAAAPGWAAAQPRALAPTPVLLAASALVLLPLSLVRAFGLLARLGLLKLCATLFITGAVLYYNAALRGAAVSTKSAGWKYSELHGDAFSALGTISFAFVCHHQTFLVLGSLANATPRRFALTTASAIFGSFAVSLTFALAGYTTFFEDTKGDIFNNYDAFRDDIPLPALLVAAKLLLATNMIVTFPGELLVARQTIESVIERVRRHRRWLALSAPVHDVALLARLKAEEEDAALASADFWAWGAPVTRALLEHVALTVALLCTAAGVAIGIDDVEKILSITGATAAVFLSFLLPAAIRLRLGACANDATPLWHRDNWAPIAVLAFGAVAFLASTGEALVNIFLGAQTES
jgi:sodium-coupled neutral amino acid transporter 11